VNVPLSKFLENEFGIKSVSVFINENFAKDTFFDALITVGW
jgi:hypothetical protein